MNEGKVMQVLISRFLSSKYGTEIAPDNSSPKRED